MEALIKKYKDFIIDFLLCFNFIKFPQKKFKLRK